MPLNRHKYDTTFYLVYIHCSLSKSLCAFQFILEDNYLNRKVKFTILFYLYFI